MIMEITDKSNLSVICVYSVENSHIETIISDKIPLLCTPLVNSLLFKPPEAKRIASILRL